MLNFDGKKTRLYQEGYAEGFDKGRVEGRGRALVGVAKRMMALDRSIEEIAQITGLKPARIRKLKPLRAGKRKQRSSFE